MSTDPDQPARIKLPTRNDRDWSAMRAPLAHLMRLAETRSQSVHHHRHTMPLGVWRRHLGMGRVPIWAQWSIIGVGIMSSPLLLLLALVPSAGCCFAGSGYPVHSRARSAPGDTLASAQSLAAGSTNLRAICATRATVSGSVAALPEPRSAIRYRG